MSVPYRDRCDRCERPPAPPLMTLANTNGTGVTAFYVCRCGHAWHTGWAWWNGQPHTTDGKTAA